MRRKFLSVVLCVCMMLTMAPFAFATGDTEGSTTPTVSTGGSSGGSGSAKDVAQIGNQTYKTLKAAIEATTSEASNIQLLSNIDIKNSNISIPSDSNITLDLNGHEILAANSDSSGIIVYGALTLEDSTDTNKDGTGQGKIYNDSDSNYVYGSFDKTLIQVYGGTFTMESGLVDAVLDNPSSNGQFAIGVYNDSADATVTINGGKIRAGWYAVAGNGQLKNHNGNIIINGGILESTADYAIYHPQAGTTTINGGIIYGQAGGICIKRGTLDVKGGTITSKGIGSTGNWGDGTGNIKNAAVIVQANYGNVTATISNGTVTAEGNAVTVSADSKNHLEANLQITGGTFSSDVSQYAAENYECVQDGDKYVVKPISEVAVAELGPKYGPKYFMTMADAINAVTEDNDTITLLKDVTEDVTVPADKIVTLNLNGKKLTNVSSNTITNNGTLTITGEGTVDNVTHSKAAVWNNVGGTVTINDGTYTRSAEASKSDKDSGGNSYYVIDNYGTLTINKGTFLFSETNKGLYSSLIHNGWYDGSKNTTQAPATMTITGGDFTQAQGGLITVKNDDYGKLEISGGNFTQPVSNYYCIYNYNEATISGGIINGHIGNQKINDDADKGRMTISGSPSITGNISNTAGSLSITDTPMVSGNLKNGESGAIIISGGYFTTDPSDYLSTNPKVYTVASDKTGYSYMVTNQAPSAAPVIVADKTEAEAKLPAGTDSEVANSINNVINNANIDGVAEAVNKDAILSAANVSANDKNNKDAKIVIDVSVNVKATGVTTTDNKAISTLTFSATPVATVKKIEGATTTTYTDAPIDVPNSYLNGQAITVKLPLPAGFDAKQIKHTSTDGSVEYFLLTEKRGAKTFTIDKNNCAVFTITKFSTFEVSGTQTYVEPSSSTPGSSGGSISTPTTYAVNVNAATNGAVAADKKTASKGTTVTVTASPSKGYVVDAVKVVDKDGKDVAVTGKDGKYVFTMPGSAVTVTGTFKAETPAPVALPFTDVKSGNWFYDAVKYAYAQGLMTGTSATTFAPNGTMNRAMIVTVLYRLEKSPAVTGASKFTDVPAGQWYSDAVAWAAANKIVNGYDETTFGPMNAVTREQMAAILFRYEQVKGLENVTLEENLNRFPDQNKISAYAIPALQWAVGQKIINGNADGTLDPTGTATRAQVAQIFTNLLNK